MSLTAACHSANWRGGPERWEEISATLMPDPALAPHTITMAASSGTSPVALSMTASALTVEEDCISSVTMKAMMKLYIHASDAKVKNSITQGLSARLWPVAFSMVRPNSVTPIASRRSVVRRPTSPRCNEAR